MNVKRVVAVLFALLLMSGCGQKGDLYRTENVPPPTMEQDPSDKKDKEE